jgi:hypothetical protein
MKLPNASAIRTRSLLSGKMTARHLDWVRLDASMLGGININQSFMTVVAVLAAALVWRHKK